MRQKFFLIPLSILDKYCILICLISDEGDKDVGNQPSRDHNIFGIDRNPFGKGQNPFGKYRYSFSKRQNPFGNYRNPFYKYRK